MNWGAIAGGAASVIGDIYSAEANKDMAESSANLQTQFAKKGIRWKVKDALAAGVHPLYAMGAQTHSFSPMAVGDTSAGTALSNLGQSMSRAAMASSTQDEKTLAALSIRQAEANLEGQHLENQYKQKQLDQIGLSKPALPGSPNFIPGQGNSGSVTTKPMEKIASDPTQLESEPYWINSIGWENIGGGAFAPTQSSDIKQRNEDAPGEYMHFLRNNIAPNFGKRFESPPPWPAKKGHTWRWSAYRQAYREYPNEKRIPYKSGGFRTQKYGPKY